MTTAESVRQVATLTAVLARSEFKLRYAGSALGAFWTAAKPLGLFAVLYFAFSFVMKFGDGVDRYPLQLLVAVVLWTFFAEATQTATTVLVARADMIRKISFPRIVLPLAVTGNAALVMTINLIAVLLICMLAGTGPSWSWLKLVPLLLELYLFTIGLSLLLAALFTTFRDIGQIWDVGLQMLFYATPIIYPITIAPAKLQPILLSSPLAQIIQDVRGSVINPTSGTGMEDVSLIVRIMPIIIVSVVIIVGLSVFNRAANRAAERV